MLQIPILFEFIHSIGKESEFLTEAHMILFQAGIKNTLSTFQRITELLHFVILTVV